MPIHLVRSQLEQRHKQPNAWLTNGELGRVDPDSQPASARGEIIAEQRSLPTLVQPPLRCQGQRTSGNDKTAP